jgi:hypothetical protein
LNHLEELNSTLNNTINNLLAKNDIINSLITSASQLNAHYPVCIKNIDENLNFIRNRRIVQSQQELDDKIMKIDYLAAELKPSIGRLEKDLLSIETNRSFLTTEVTKVKNLLKIESKISTDLEELKNTSNYIDKFEYKSQFNIIDISKMNSEITNRNQKVKFMFYLTFMFF